MPETEISKFYDKVKWVFRVFYRYHKEGYSGPVTFQFFQGNLKHECKREITERAPE